MILMCWKWDFRERRQKNYFVSFSKLMIIKSVKLFTISYNEKKTLFLKVAWVLHSFAVILFSSIGEKKSKKFVESKFTFLRCIRWTALARSTHCKIECMYILSMSYLLNSCIRLSLVTVKKVRREDRLCL